MKKLIKIKSFGFNSLKIRTKLTVAFLMVSILAVIVGVVGLYNMSKSHKEAVKIYEHRLIPIKELSTINLNLLRIRSNNIYMLYDNEDLEKLEQREKENIEWINKNKVLLENYKKLPLSDNEEELLSNFERDILPYIAMREKFEKYIKDGNELQALRVASEYASIRENVEEDIQNLIEESNLQAELLLQDIDDNYRNSIILMITIIVLGVMLAGALGLYFANKIGKPIKEILVAADNIAEGNLDVDLEVKSKDEIGEMAIAFNNMTENLNKVIINIDSASEQVAAGAGQVSDSSTSLSQGATEQASSIEELTASIEEIYAQTKQNAKNSNNAKEIAEKAKEYAVEGNNQMQEMVIAMGEINDSSNSISKIIKVIDEIAFQTNILALNAAVEAARAGQHGRGFAVVAEEVRNLAARSANAAKETTDMIEGSIKNVERGTNIANSTAVALGKIVNGISEAATLVGNIAVASNEQAIGVEQVNKGINQIADVVQTTSATSEETAAASEELSSQAEMLKSQVRTFKIKNNNKDTYKSIKSTLDDEPLLNEGMEDLNPDVLKLLKNMKEKAMVDNNEVISLSDKEFEKY
ncbi:methyl-accepting chemotaxis protein [Clostridium sediminicola]|uniref:methyl-accepting chemotaxis protein n=1 Tax=Clostridium sediminicola TaxID=3114879 RepID=UPI0031F1E118